MTTNSNSFWTVAAIPHVEFLRIGFAHPDVPAATHHARTVRDAEKFHPLFMSIHSNHPRELTTEVRDALGRLADAGIPLGNQSVLLKHVNDDAAVMKGAMSRSCSCAGSSRLTFTSAI